MLSELDSSLATSTLPMVYTATLLIACIDPYNELFFASIYFSIAACCPVMNKLDIYQYIVVAAKGPLLHRSIFSVPIPDTSLLYVVVTTLGNKQAPCGMPNGSLSYFDFK